MLCTEYVTLLSIHIEHAHSSEPWPCRHFFKLHQDRETWLLGAAEGERPVPTLLPMQLSSKVRRTYIFMIEVEYWGFAVKTTTPHFIPICFLLFLIVFFIVSYVSYCFLFLIVSYFFFLLLELLGFVLLFSTLVCCQSTELILGFFFVS